ncbi:MAG: 2-C-methyl-D-erythritol 4-phosphate cytidylyltransferase [bacterium]|nr:2-C-methyl-D-erythritol 4-phosphate cytidylyltransferase [bacterium]
MHVGYLSYALLIPAAGRGERFGGPVPKALTLLDNRPLIWRALLPFAGDDRLTEVVIATSSDCDAAIKSALVDHPLFGIITTTEGGATRQDSVGKALDRVDSDVDHILVHDAARPLLSRKIVDLVVTALDSHAAAAPGVPVTDTIKRADASGVVTETLPRAELFSVQTPQGIRVRAFRDAHRLARQGNVQCTDDVALIEFFSLGTVLVVPGDPRNLKITHPHELPRALTLLRDE